MLASKYEFSAGALFHAPADIIKSLARWDDAPGVLTRDSGGLIVVGLGNTGEQVVEQFEKRCRLFPGEFNRKTRVLLRVVAVPKPEQRPAESQAGTCFYLGNQSGAGGRTQVSAGTPGASEFKKLVTTLQNEIIRLRADGVSEVRCVVVASLAEAEIGLVGEVLKVLARLRVESIDRSLVLSLVSGNTVRLAKDYQYAAVRELAHYLQFGVHDARQQAGEQQEGVRDTRLQPGKWLEHLYIIGESEAAGAPAVERVTRAMTEALVVLFGASPTALRQVISEGVHALGIRSLGVPLQELGDYFSGLLMAEMLTLGSSLYPMAYPGADEKERIRKEFLAGTHRDLLNDWLGNELINWVMDASRPRPALDENKTSEHLLKAMAGFLADATRSNRHVVGLVGLGLLAEHLAGAGAYPRVAQTCQGCVEAINRLYVEGNTAFKMCKEQLEEKRALLVATQTDEVVRWNSPAPLREAERLYANLLGEDVKGLVIKSIQERIGVAVGWQADTRKVEILPFCIPADVEHPQIIDQYRAFSGAEYLEDVAKLVNSKVAGELEKAGLALERPDERAVTFLMSGEKLVEKMALNNPGSKRTSLLVSADEVAPGSALMGLKSFEGYWHIVRGNPRLMDFVLMQLGLRMLDFPSIRLLEDSYKHATKRHLDIHLTNAVFFEKRMRELEIEGGERPLCEEVVLTLENVEACRAFFAAFFAKSIGWVNRDRIWQVKKTRDEGGVEYAALDLTLNHFGLDKANREKSIEWLWKAYQRFMVDLPLVEVVDGAMQNPVHPNNRKGYLSALLAVNGQAQFDPETMAWLRSQVKSCVNNPVLFDFYRLAQVVWETNFQEN